MRDTATAAMFAVIATFATPSLVRAQKALVYCPIGIDVAGCTNLVAALQPVFLSGVDRGYDGSGGTVDLRTANLWGYSLIAIPSLATTGGATPYAVLSDTATGSRLHDAVLGRVALWSGTPDLGSPNGTQKDTLIQNLGKWAAASFGSVKGPGLVVFQDMSDSIATQYGWLHVIVGTAIQGDSTVSTHASVQGVTPTGTALLRDASGNAIAYANMAAFGFMLPGAGSGFTVDGVAASGAGTQSVLLTSPGGNTGGATITTDADDYPPGSIVTITGAGFTAGEKVMITFRERPFFDTPATTMAVADKTGGFVDTSFSPDSADLGVRFIATATGQSSGLRAVTTFTDAISINGNSLTAGAQSPGTVAAGGSVTFALTVAFNGNNGSCTVGLSVTGGLPAGATATFAPPTLTNTANTSLNSTLTIATTSATPVGTSNLTLRALGTGGAGNDCNSSKASTTGVTLSVSAPALVAGNTSVSSSAPSSTFGQSVTFTATVSPSTGPTTPTGSIQFLDNGANLGAAVPLSGGVATLSTSALGAGSHTISATYTPGTGFAAGTVSSTSLVVNKAIPQVSWNTPAAITYGTPLGSAQLNATAVPTSGTFTYTPAAAAVLGAGTQTLGLVFTPTDLVDYAVTSVAVQLTVNKLAATVAADNQTRPFGQQNPTLTGTLSGFLTADNVSATYATTATQTSDVGSYAITPTLVDPNARLGNYTVTPSAGTLTITQATQSISFTAPAGVHYGDADITLGATATSGAPVSYVSSTTSACTIVGTSVHVVSAGNCSVTAQQPGTTNYSAATDVTQSFAIAQRAIGVTANALGKTYGAPDPTLTYVVGPGSLVGTDAFSGSLTRASGENAGTYAIAQGTLTAGSNYALTFTGATFTIDKADQTITFTQPADPTFGDSPLTLTATASSGLTVAFAASGTCSVSGSSLSITGAGSCVVTASQLGDQNHNAAPNVVYTLKVKKATPVVSAQGGTFTYDGLTHAATVGATGVGGASLAPVSVTYNGSITLPKNAGTYAVVATYAGSADYLAGSANATITIDQKALTVTADDKSKVYGAAAPSFTASYSGFVTNEGPSDLSGTLTFGGPATSAVDAGTYVITPSGVSSPNYAITFGNGTLTVSRAPLAVKAADASRVYGDPNPAFTGTLTGVVNNDNITASYASAAVAASSVGTLPITAALIDPNSRLANYDVTNTPGTLTITAAPLTVRGDDASRVYGDANPTLTGSITGIKNSDPITATYTTSAGIGSDVGSYPVTPTLVDPSSRLSNYSVTSADGVLTITKAPLVIAAANASRLYGGSNPALTGTITGIKNGDGITATYSTSATPQDNVGSYAIVPAAVDPTPSRIGNYAVTLTNGTLSVAPAPLTVTANPSTKVYGDANPTFAATYAGFVNSETPSVLTGTLIFTTPADVTTGVGSLSVTPSGLTSTNYDITFTPGQLTITQAPLTIAAANASRAYGSGNPTFSGTISGIRNNDPITATYGAPATAATDVGNYPIVPTPVDANPAKLPNYSVTLTNGTLTITRAPLTVTPANVTLIQGDQLPILTGVVVGIMNSDPITASYTTTAVTQPYVTGTPGPYDINASLADPNNRLGNYSVTLNKGTLTLTANAPPVLGAVSAPSTPVQLGASITASASFTDVDVTPSTPYATAIDWGDGQKTTGSLAAPGTITGVHRYGSAGVYTVTIAVSDKINIMPVAQSFQYVVIYDPSAGFVTGGGWINSPPAACQLSSACAGATGKATFGFNARYQKGANVPDGSTEFQFQAGGLNFKSTTYQWLVVAGSKAQYKGVGSINGKGTYNFLLTAVDGDLQNGKADAFRIKITDPSTGNAVYDNQMGSDDTSNNATILGGGSIVIHQ